ncbi:MAG: PilZ domain-containing protein [Planctomycetes bacterium]|nr:PilZ domain-containing protein [Planctomycetota bacterium]
MAELKGRDSTSQNVGRINTLGMSITDLAALLKRLDEADKAAASKSRRFKRRQFRLASLEMEVHHAGGVPTKLSVVCRNISSGGAALLHNSFLHVGTKIILSFKNAARGNVSVVGKVAHCSHVRAQVHQLGIKFDQPIKPSDFLQLDPLDDWFTLENVKDEEMRGCIVLAGTSDMEAKLVQSFLKGTEIRLRCSGDQATAFAHAAEGADLIIADPDQQKFDIGVFIREAASSGLATPILVVTARGPDERRRILREFEPAAVLAKPLTRDVFTRALGEFLIVGRSAASTVSSMQTTDEKISLLPEFVRSLHASACDLRALLERNELDATQAICAQIASAAPPMGFAGIGALADQAVKSLTQTRSVESSKPTLQRIIGACESAQATRRAA